MPFSASLLSMLSGTENINSFLLRKFTCFCVICLFFTINFQECHERVNSLDQIRPSVWSNLGPKCLQRLSANDISRQGVKEAMFINFSPTVQLAVIVF